jgi:hypothetical protein
MECNVSTMRELTTNSYIPDGMTALLDAIGEGVMNLKARKSEEFENDEATAVVVIMTDGHENSSRIFQKEAIRRMIRELEATENWTFSFMGATHDALEVANDMNIRSQNAMKLDKQDIKASMQRVSREMATYAEEKSLGNKIKDFFREEE